MGKYYILWYIIINTMKIKLILIYIYTYINGNMTKIQYNNSE